MPKHFSSEGTCSNCKSKTKAILHAHFRANGAKGYMWLCSRCNRRDPFGQGLFVSNSIVEERLTPQEIELLPVIIEAFFNRCAKCGSRGGENHHWAPKEIFGDAEAERWPQDWLCTPCHIEWHKMMNLPLPKA